jgi:hypothetical protein
VGRIKSGCPFCEFEGRRKAERILKQHQPETVVDQPEKPTQAEQPAPVEVIPEPPVEEVQPVEVKEPLLIGHGTTALAEALRKKWANEESEWTEDSQQESR